TWLRWRTVDLAAVEDPRAYPVRIVTRQSLNQLRGLARRRESYVGPWLPEPVRRTPDDAEVAEIAARVPIALMLVLETLSPTERAVFVLREVFDVGYDEIAAALDKSAAAVRQIAHRARAHVAARRPREVVTAGEADAAIRSFRRAIETGDLQGLLDVLAPDVVLVADGGGVQAARRPVTGADRVARMIVGGFERHGLTPRAEPVTANGRPALVLRLDGRLDGVIGFEVEDGRIARLYYVRNPEKLALLDAERTLTRR